MNNTYCKKSLYFKSGKRGIIENKGAQNASKQESASDVESNATQRGRDISEMRERHAREVESQGQKLVDASAAGVRIFSKFIENLKSADPKQGIIHIIATNNV